MVVFGGGYLLRRTRSRPRSLHLGGAQLGPHLGSWRGEKEEREFVKNRLLPLETRADGDPEKRLSPALSPLDLTHAQPETHRPDPSLTLLRASPRVASGRLGKNEVDTQNPTFQGLIFAIR